jgi:hypothetical protein
MRKNLLALIGGAMMVCGFASTSFAAPGGGSTMEGIFVDFNGLMYNQTRVTSPGSSSDDNLYIYDIKLGYIMSSGLYLGGAYTTRSHNGSAVSGEDGTATGASICYVSSSGFFLIGDYYFDAKLGNYTNGSGYQGDFGYLGNVAGPFYIGVELTYRDLTYKGSLPTGINSYEVKELLPMLSVAFIF